LPPKGGKHSAQNKRLMTSFGFVPDNELSLDFVLPLISQKLAPPKRSIQKQNQILISFSGLHIRPVAPLCLNTLY